MSIFKLWELNVEQDCWITGIRYASPEDTPRSVACHKNLSQFQIRVIKGTPLIMRTYSAETPIALLSGEQLEDLGELGFKPIP